MFGKKSIVVCVPHGLLMDAWFVDETGNTKNVPDVSFQTLRSHYHVSRVRLLLSEDDTYIKLLLFPKGTRITRVQVIQQATEVIPEDIEDGFMDWKEISFEQDRIGVQLYVVKKAVLAPLLTLAADAKITIESCEPPSSAMARMVNQPHIPCFIVYPKDKPLYCAAVFEHSVLEVMSIDSLQSCTDYIKKQWGITIKTTVSSPPDPVLGLAAKTDITGTDADTLNIPSNQKIEHPHSAKAALISFFIVLFFIEVIGSGIWLWKK